MPTKRKKTEYKPDFLIIPGQIAFDDKLRPLDKMVYGVVYWLERLKDGKCTASNQFLADICNSTLYTVANSLSRLEEMGYIKRVFIDENRKIRSEIICLISYKGFNQAIKGFNQVVKGGLIRWLTDKKEDISNINTEEDKKEVEKEDSSPDKQLDKQVNNVISLFKPLDPFFDRHYSDHKQRSVIKKLIKIYGEDAIKTKINQIIYYKGKPMFPLVVNPYDLRDKWARIDYFIQNNA